MPPGKYLRTEEHRRRQGFQKGNQIGKLNKGKHWKLSVASHIKGTHREWTKSWKGDKVSYVGLHQWVARWKGKPSRCEMCGIASRRRYEWANIDQQYRRVLDDYIRLCVPCHRRYDHEKSKNKVQN